MDDPALRQAAPESGRRPRPDAPDPDQPWLATGTPSQELIIVRVPRDAPVVSVSTCTQTMINSSGGSLGRGVGVRLVRLGVDAGLGALGVGDRRGGAGERVEARAGLREGDHLTDRVHAG